MNRDEWNQVLATEPATDNQRGAILREFDRLGVDDRPERLAICAALLGLDELGSTNDLVMGDAGYLVNLLRRTRDRAELPDVTAAAVDDGQDGKHDSRGERISIADTLQHIAIVLYLAFAEKGGAA